MEPTFTIPCGAPDTGNGRISRVALAGAIKFNPIAHTLGAPARPAAGAKAPNAAVRAARSAGPGQSRAIFAGGQHIALVL